MPVHPVKGRPGCYQWGDSGKVYCGDGAKEKAEAQQRAAYANGYRGKAEMMMPASDEYQYGDDRWWLYLTWEIKDKDTLMAYRDEGRFQIWILLQPYHYNRGKQYGGKITFICTAKYADAKTECERWIARNLPHTKGEPQYIRRSMNKDVRDNGKYYSVEFLGLTYNEEAYGRKHLDGYYAAEEDKKNFTTIEDIEVGDVFKFGDGWERFVLKSKEIDGYEFDDEDGEIILYKIVFDPYKPSPVSDINGLVKSNVKMVRWNNPYLRMAKRRAGIKEAEELGLDEFRDGLYNLFIKGKITEEQFIAWGDDYEAYLEGDKGEKPPFAAEENKKPYSVEIARSSNPEKKLMAVFSDKEGNKIKTTHFGQRGASDYTKHGDKERMERYLERHGGGTTTSTKEDWKDPTTAGALSRWILWNKPSLSGSFSDFKRRFGLKGTMKVSKSAEQEGEKEVQGKGIYFFDPASPTGLRHETLFLKDGGIYTYNRPKKDNVLVPEKMEKIMKDIGATDFGMTNTTGDYLWIYPQFRIEEYPQGRQFNPVQGGLSDLYDAELIKVLPATEEEEAAWIEKKKEYPKLIEEYEKSKSEGRGLRKVLVKQKQMKRNERGLYDKNLVLKKVFTIHNIMVKPYRGRFATNEEKFSNKPTHFKQDEIDKAALTYDPKTDKYSLKQKGRLLGAEFEAKSPAQKSLNKWTKEDWGTKSGKPSTQGKDATGERYLPRKAREALTDKEYARTSAKKRRDTAKGKQFSPQPDDIEEKVKKYRTEQPVPKRDIVMNFYEEILYDEDSDLFKMHQELNPPNQEPKFSRALAYNLFIYSFWKDEVPKNNRNGTPKTTKELIRSANKLQRENPKKLPIKDLSSFMWTLSDASQKYRIQGSLKERFNEVQTPWLSYKNKIYYWEEADTISSLNNDFVKEKFLSLPTKQKMAILNKNWERYRDYRFSKEELEELTAGAIFKEMRLKGLDGYVPRHDSLNKDKMIEIYEKRMEKYAEQVFEAIEGKGSKARFTDQPDPKIYRDTGLRQKARNSLLKGTKGGDAGEWSARKAQMAATKYRTMYENKYGKGKNPYFAEEEKPLALRDMVELKDVTKRDLPNGGEQVNLFYMVLGSKGDAYRYTIQSATSERPIHQCTCKGWQFGRKRAAKGLPRCKHEKMVKTVQMITDKSPEERKQLLRSIGNGDDEYAQSLGFESRRQAILDVGSFMS